LNIMSLVFVFLLFLTTTLCSPQCSVCKKMIDTLTNQISGGDVTELKVRTAVQSLCSNFALQDWCQKNINPYLYDLFLALNSQEATHIVCERINLCHFKINSITGDVLFAERDRLDRIIPVGETGIERTEWGVITHPELTNMNITGLACAPDYCALLLRGTSTSGKYITGITALSSTSQDHHVLNDGRWSGPWYDIHTNQFWLSLGHQYNITFGIFDTQIGSFIPKITFRSYFTQHARIVSGTILNRILYFSIYNDPRIFVLDIATHIYRGNFTAPKNTMLVGNPVTNELYGYTNGNDGIFRFDSYHLRTRIAEINFTGVLPVPSSTINPIDNTMWLSLWNFGGPKAWMKVNLKTNGVGWAPVGNLEGYFDFNPYDIKSEEV